MLGVRVPPAGVEVRPGRTVGPRVRGQLWWRYGSGAGIAAADAETRGSGAVGPGRSLIPGTPTPVCGGARAGGSPRPRQRPGRDAIRPLSSRRPPAGVSWANVCRSSSGVGHNPDPLGGGLCCYLALLYGHPGATRSHQEPPGTTRSHQERPGATRGASCKSPVGWRCFRNPPRCHLWGAPPVVYAVCVCGLCMRSVYAVCVCGPCMRWDVHLSASHRIRLCVPQTAHPVLQPGESSP